ncbi:MAG: hypothetical protein ABIE22_04615 [archaeon]
MITSSLFFNEHPVNPEAREYILRLLKQVDMNSKFYQKNKDLIGAVNNGDPNQIEGFKDRRYNALLIYSNGDIIGHAGYQAHFQDNLFHLGIIQGYLQEKERNVSNAKALLSEMVKHSRSGKVDRLRFSKKRAGEVTMRSLQR